MTVEQHPLPAETLSRASEQHAPGVLAMLASTREQGIWTGSRFGLPVSSDRFSRHIRSAGDPLERHECFVLAGDTPDEIVAYGELTRIDETAGNADLSRLVVHPCQRGRGIGAVLVGVLLDRAAQRGMSTVGLRVFEENQVALRLYERLGFSRTGLRVQRVVGDERWEAVELTFAINSNGRGTKP